MGESGEHAPSFMSGMMGVARITSPLMHTILSMSAQNELRVSSTNDIPWGLSSRMLT